MYCDTVLVFTIYTSQGSFQMDFSYFMLSNFVVEFLIRPSNVDQFDQVLFYFVF